MAAEREWADLDPRLWRSREDLEAEVAELRDKLDLYMIFARLQTEKLEEVLARPRPGAKPKSVDDLQKRQKRNRRAKARSRQLTDDSVFGAQALAAHNLHIAKKGRQ